MPSAPSAEVSFAAIEAAAEQVRAANLTTPEITSPVLSDMTGADIHLKLENFQPTGSFKVRGALIKLLSLSDAERDAGVIAVSAGNHAQGVAYHAQRLGVRATIVMPDDTPFTKVRATERLGARVILAGESLADAWAAADRLVAEQGFTFLHPFDDPAVIAGQGTAALELLSRFPELDCLVVPVGGGGLIAGTAIVARHLRPEIEIIGVQAELFPSMRNAMTGEIRPVGGRTVADGIAVKGVGRMTAEIVKAHVSEIVVVGEAELERAMLGFLHHQRIAAEGAGAAPLAAVTLQPDRFHGRRVGLIVSGGNVDARLLSSILLRGLAREGHLVRIRVEIEDRPGELAEIAELIGGTGGNIVEVVHQRLFYNIPVRQTEVDITLETRDLEHVSELLDVLSANGFPARALSSTADKE